jgi:hypothetical protein
MLQLPDWSDEDDEDNDRSELQPPPSPLSRTALLEKIKEYKSILQSIDYQQTTDLTQSLASRAHLERLVDRYWDHGLKERQVEDDADDEGELLDDEVKDKLKVMILHHPFFRVSPLLLRWPLLAADVPKPRWTLSDEILAVLEKQRRVILGTNSDGIKDEYVDPIDIDIALPAIVSCQHALVAVLHDLAITSESHSSNSSSSAGNRRDSIFNWRDILSTLAMRSDVPASVFKSTQHRVERIYGQIEKAAPSFWMSNMGIGGTDMILETMKRQDGIPSKHQTVTRPVAKRHQDSLKALDEELLLAPATKKARYLEEAPIKGRVKRARR